MGCHFLFQEIQYRKKKFYQFNQLVRTEKARPGLPRWLRDEESACNAGDASSNLGSGRSPGEGNGNPLQHSCLDNPMDRGTWQVTSLKGHKEEDITEQLNSNNSSSKRKEGLKEATWHNRKFLLGRTGVPGSSPILSPLG